jgi:hypothetical protein
MTTPPVLEFSVSSRGKPVLLCNGFIFNLNKKHQHVKYWRCEVRSCAVSIQTDDNDVYKAMKGQHDIHLPAPERIELLGFKQKVKDRVMKETTPITRIYDQELAAANLSSVALALAPLAKDARESLSCPLAPLFTLSFRTFSSSNTPRNNARFAIIIRFQHF